MSHDSLSACADPWAVSHPHIEAAAWLRDHADKHGTGSRDFGRGYMHAANVLADSTTQPAADAISLTVRFGIARSLLERPPSEHVCRLIAAVMTGATLADLIAMEVSR